MRIKLCNIEFNEANCELIENYLREHSETKWPNIRKMFSLNKIETSSEEKYELLEPWIQWASVHTGKTASEHAVFRLGDINNCSAKQFFEILEEQNLSVGCISAMNAENRLAEPAYFIPDPWTVTQTDGSFFSEKIYTALHQSVNDNSSGKLTKSTIFYLLLALLFKSRMRNWLLYIKLALKALKKQKWNKALFLDLFISDLHIKNHKNKKPDFTSVFFNAFAHIQHHYYFNSKFYDGPISNPVWYIPEGTDPFLDALEVYDRIIGDHLGHFKNSEIIISTGLRQVPYTQRKFYYRLCDHTSFLSKLNLPQFTVYPRMTRDFLMEFSTEACCEKAKNILEMVKINEALVFGEIDNRGKSLFVTLTYPDMIKPNDVISTGTGGSLNPTEEFVFVAVKNGMHDSIGYSFTTSDSGEFKNLNGQHVKNLFGYILGRFGVAQ